MAGRLVPLVLVPRYTSFTLGPFHTLPIDATGYERAIVTLWRGPLPEFASVAFSCQESTDQQYWPDCAGTNTSAYDPGADTQGVVLATITKRWFRFQVHVNGDDSQVTCWAAGHLERRQR